MRKAILFDMDGVLVDSEPVITEAAVEALNRFGIPAKAEDFKPFTGMGEIRFLGGVAGKYGREYRDEMKQLCYSLYGEIVAEKLKVYEDTVPVLRELKAANVPMALASSADLVKVKYNLDVAGIPFDTFGVVLAAEDVEKRKPFPDLYLRSAEALGYDPKDCVVVEDALSGIQAGKAAGCEVYALTTSFDRQRLLAEGADGVIERLSELLPIALGE